MSEKQTYRFEYEFIIDKIPKILGYNVPDFYSNIDNAKLDVEMICQYHNAFEKAPIGKTKYIVEVIYLANKDGQYEPKIGELKQVNNVKTHRVHRSDYEIIMSYSLWEIIKAKLKRLFKRGESIKINRA